MAPLDLKVGQTRDGISLPYISETVESFTWVHCGAGEITGRTGDIPAAQVPLNATESAVILHRTEPRRLVHIDWKKFLEYLAMEGLDGIAEEHERRRLPRTGSTETYTRHAELALITAGQPINDRYLGSPVETVPDRVTKTGEGLEVSGRVVTDGEPGAHQVSAFSAASDETKTVRRETQSDGGFTFGVPVGPVLLNTVAIMPALTTDAAWHSEWASLFARLR